MTFFYDLNKKLDSIREKPETTHKQLNERDMSRAAKGYEKYGKQGMEALAKAGREGKALDPIRKKYDKYDEGIEDRIGDLDMTNPVNQPAYQRKAAAQGGAKSAIGKRHEGFPRFSGGQKPADMPKSHEGFPRYSGDASAVKETGGKPMTAKQKSFAKLAPPADKITFADKIAGAKKEVDEMLGDVAAEAMKSALSGGQKKLDKNDNGRLDANDFEMLRKGGGKAPEAKISRHSTLKKVSNTKSGLSGYVPNDRKETDEGWDDMIKDVDRRRGQMKTGEKTQGHKGEIEKTSTGIRHTRRYDAKTGETDVGDDTPASGEKRGRGRPKGTKAAIGAKGPSGRSKLMTKEAASEDDIQILVRMRDEAFEDGNKMLGNKIEDILQMLDDSEEQVSEKAVSKKQQRFMGMVHATQKGEKAPSKKVANVAKSMGKKDAEDFAATKHKGLPEKKKSDDASKKKKEKTEEAGGSGTPTASSGFSYGKGIYDSFNREVEGMIAEGMNVSMNMTNDGAHGGPTKSLTVTATDEDAAKLAEILKMAGLGGGTSSGCGCGSTPCSCDQMDEAYGDTTPTENAPDYPTNTETSDDALQYSGGLNKPKSTGQTTVPVIASQEERQHSYADMEEDAIKRMMEMAGVEKSNQINEGLLNNLKDMIVPKLMKLLGPDSEKIASAVRQATGGDLTPNKENAMKVVQALGLDKAAAQGQSSQMAEGIAGNWQGKLIQSLYTLGLLGSAGAAASMYGTVGGSFMGVVGVLLLMFAATFFGDAPGQVGVYGKFGNKGTSAQRGLDDHGMPVRNTNVDEDDLDRMMEMAGIKKKAVDEEKTDEGNKFTGNLAKARAAGKKEADLDGDGDMEKVKESIFDLTNQWKAYKG